MGQKPAQYGEPLSGVEEKLTEMVLCGMGARRIARETGRTEQVAKNILRRIYRKLGVHSASELIAEAYSQHALELWTGKRGFYDTDPKEKPAPPRFTRPPAPPQPWEKKFCVKLSPSEIRFVRLLVENPDWRIRDMAPKVHTSPSALSNAFSAIRWKAGVQTQTGLLAFVMTP
jgi:DNA-binding CsgD family transcriptional regulator